MRLSGYPTMTGDGAALKGVWVCFEQRDQRVALVGLVGFRMDRALQSTWDCFEHTLAMVSWVVLEALRRSLRVVRLIEALYSLTRPVNQSC